MLRGGEEEVQLVSSIAVSCTPATQGDEGGLSLSLSLVEHSEFCRAGDSLVVSSVIDRDRERMELS